MVTKIKEMGLTKLRNGEHLGFHLEVQLFLNHCGAENIMCTSELLLYDVAIMAEVRIVRRKCASVLTGDMDRIDKERDKLISLLFATFDTAKNSHIDASREANKQLRPVMKPYRGIARYTHLEETGAVIGLIKALRAERIKKHIEALNFSPIIDLLEAKNEEYIKFDLQRIYEIPRNVDTETLRKNVDELYHQIINKANATVTLATNEAAETLVKNLNNYIHQTNASYNLSRARRGGTSSTEKKRS